MPHSDSRGVTSAHLVQSFMETVVIGDILAAALAIISVPSLELWLLSDYSGEKIKRLLLDPYGGGTGAEAAISGGAAATSARAQPV